MSENSFFNEQLDFYVEKPPNWSFLPTSWVVNFRKEINHRTERAKRILEQASVPFVCIQKDVEDGNFAFPTFQTTCRYFPSPSDSQKDRLLEMQLQFLSENFNSLEVIESSQSESISGHPANYFSASFIVANQQGEEFHCISRAWCVFCKDLAFSIGQSGDLSNLEDYQAEQEFITKSVLIGASDW